MLAIAGGILLWAAYSPVLAIPAMIGVIAVIVFVYKRVSRPINGSVIAAVAKIEQQYGLADGVAFELFFELLQSDEGAMRANEFKDFVRTAWGSTFVYRLTTRLKKLEDAKLQKEGQDYERDSLPLELRTGDLVGFAKATTGDSAISLAAVAFWPDETSSAEKLASGLAMRLATGGFVGGPSGKTPFGIIALSAMSLWRIEVGYTFNRVTLYDASNIKKTGGLEWKRAEIRTRRLNDSRHLHLLLSVPSHHSTIAKTVGPDLSLFFPSEFDDAERGHAFFKRVLQNGSASLRIAGELKAADS
jgi:hypothetical protein